MSVPAHVLLVSPSHAYRPDGNFGDAHLVALGSFLRARTGASVELIDLDYEAYLASPAPERVFDRGFGVVAISCYSSFDYLSAFYLAGEIRKRNPAAVIVAGGYHASARPGDFLNLPASELEEPSAFDHVVVGEGELPLARIVEAAQRGERLADKVLGPEPVMNLDDLPSMDWGLMDRYRPVARGIGGQVAMSLSRGCPFGCSFCMERSKGETSWRPWSPARAEDELRALDQWLGLKGWTLFIADALFGLNPSWRREMLERLARLNFGLEKTWLLSRIDLIGPGDVERYHAANCGIGFGLESGDERMLALIAKALKPAEFLARFGEVAREAARVGLPWGANVIAGHPGETTESLENSARLVEKVFTQTEGLTGFLSVDPFRLYPGSLVERDLAWYEKEFGTRIHRKRWWNYSEQAFTSEWVDPSAALDYHAREALTARLFEPITATIAGRFAYRGPATDYFQRAVANAQELFGPGSRLRTLADYHLWRGLTGDAPSSLVTDDEATSLFRRERREEVQRIVREMSLAPSPALVDAVIDEPREKYLPADQVLHAAEDIAIALTDDGRATISAMHAYLVNYGLLELSEGDRLLELGGGTGYGAALAGRVVGERGRVVSVEIIPELAARAKENLAGRPNVEVVCGDASAVVRPGAFNKVLFTFAVEAAPQRFIDALPEGGRLVAPVGNADQQMLTMWVRRGGAIEVTRHGAVRYVRAAV